MEYVSKYDGNTGLWTILSRPVGGSYWTQVCKWCKTKSYVERKLVELKKGEQL